MISAITATIGGLLVVIFLGYYAVMLDQLPLWIVIGAVLIMVITDFFMTVRDEKRRGQEKEERDTTQ